MLLLLSITAGAIPAKRVQRTLTLADGRQVTATQCGDENFHYWKTSDGRALVASGEGTFTEMTLSQAQERLATRVQANNSRRRARNARRKSAWGAETNPISGERKGLVVLVNFKNLSLKHTRAEYDDYFNKVGYSANGCSGSVHDYFLSQSYGKFSLDFDVMGPVTLSKNYSYYGANDSDGNDKYAGEMVAEAVKLAVSGIDLSQYDWDGDGYVDQVYVVYAGYGEHAGASASTIWPHEYELSSASQYGDGPGAVTIGGVTVDTYACSCELRGTSGSTMDGIGTACHEFSHCMCLPDMYDTQGSNFGMDTWDLMDYGSYRGEDGWGESPAPYTSYERMYCGWLTPVELTGGCEVTDMPAITSEPVAYMLRNDNPRYPGEYYLLENHQQEGWDEYAPAHGMLVVHVDFDSKVWTDNSVNTSTSHQRMTIIPGDNKLSSENTAGDTWPGTSRNTALTDTSRPSATLYNANSNGRKYMGHPIENIAEKNGKVSFTFDGGTPMPQLDKPASLVATQVTAGGFTAQWQTVDGATSYEVTLTERSAGSASVEESILLDEDFAGFNNGGKSDGTQDLASQLDNYTQVTGWTGVKLYTTPGDEVKMGSSKAQGKLYTPTLQPSGSDLTVVVMARRYGSDTSELQCGYTDASGQTSIVDKGALGAEEACYTFSLSDLDGNCSIALLASKRAYISRVVVLDGSFTADDVASLFDTSAKTLAREGLHRAVKTTTVTTTATSYTFTGLSPENTYTCRVRALADGYTPSEWSDEAKVELSTGIGGLAGEDGQGTGGTAVYDLQGRRVTRPVHGIYIKDGRKYMTR